MSRKSPPPQVIFGLVSGDFCRGCGCGGRGCGVCLQLLMVWLWW